MGAESVVTVRVTFVERVRFPSWALMVRVYWPGTTEFEAVTAKVEMPAPEMEFALKTLLAPGGKPETLNVTVSSK